MDVFISWTGEDRAVKQKIVERLQAEKIVCWESDEGCVSDFSSNCIEALKHCQVFIVIVSDASMRKGYVINEVIAARRLEGEGKLNILVYKITDAPYTDQFEFQLNHISSVTENLVQQRQAVYGESGIDIIVRRTLLLLKRRKEGRPEKPFTVNVPKVEGMEITRAGYFVERSRDDTLRSLEEAFQKANVVMLQEFVGYGKRSTAKKYAELHRGEYDSIVLIDNGPCFLRDFFLFHLRFENLNEKLFDALEGNRLIEEKLRYLNRLDEKTLLVVSNILLESEPDPFLYQHLPQLRCRMLLLVQESAVRYRSAFPVVALGPMEDPYLYELFFHYYDYALEEEKQRLKDPLSAFFTQIGGHTKTVELTAAVLARDYGVPPEELPNYLSMSGQEGRQLKDQIFDQIAHLIDLERLSEPEVIALTVASIMAVPRVSEKDYRAILRICGMGDWRVVSTLDSHRWLDLDMKNRTVSLEPLIAQVLQKKLPANYAIYAACLEYFESHFSMTSYYVGSERYFYAAMDRLVNLFRATGLPEIFPQFVEHLTQLMKDREEKDEYTAFSRVFQEFKDLYGSQVLPEDEEDEDAEEDLEEEPNAPEWDQASYLARAVAFVKETMFPMAKMALVRPEDIPFFPLSQGTSPQGSFAPAGEDLESLNFEELFGISQEECRSMLDFLSQREGTQEDLEEDELEVSMWLEAMTALDAFYQRDYATIMQIIRSMLKKALLFPEFTEVISLFYYLVYTVAQGFIRMGGEHSAEVLCRNALQVETKTKERVLVLKTFLDLLRNNKEYTPELFEAYEELFGEYGSSFEREFESRRDSLTEKKMWRLKYANDLARGGEFAQAEEQFDAAMQEGFGLLPEWTVEVADEIANLRIQAGQFEAAMAFLRRYFFQNPNAAALKTEDPQTQERLENFTILLEYHASGGTQETEETGEYISYYHDFLAERNNFGSKRYEKIAANAMTYDFSGLSDQELAQKAEELREKAQQMPMMALAPEAFALTSEAGKRVLGYQHHYVQYLGAAAMADGKVAEMLNGEGKTYTIVLTAVLHHLYGKKVFIVDLSPYLTQRNYLWMRGVFEMLGLNCRWLSQCSQLTPSYRQADITYTTIRELVIGILCWENNSRLGSDYLRLDSVIIDEADTVLVDNAIQKYSLTSGKGRDRDMIDCHRIAYDIALEAACIKDSYTWKNGQVTLLPALFPVLEKRFGFSYGDVGSVEEIQEIEGIVCRAILCCNHMELGKDYFIHENAPKRENKQSGSFEEIGPTDEYFLCRVNGLPLDKAEKEIAQSQDLLNSTCLRDALKRFSIVCGTTATAVSFRKEFKEIYDLEYVSVPPARPCIRKDQVSPVFVSRQGKESAIVKMVAEKHAAHQPVLLIGSSIQEATHFSDLLSQAKIPHRILTAENERQASQVLSEAGILDSVLVASVLANRGVDIKLGGDPEERTRREIAARYRIPAESIERMIYATPEERKQTSELYQQYCSLLEKNRAFCAKEKEKVVQAGGLCVIGVSFFPEPRTEQQLRGRSGRQGDVGESWVFQSVEDEAMQQLLHPGYLKTFQAIMDDVEVLDSSLLRSAIKRAQKMLHDQKFYGIRHNNSSFAAVEKGRKVYIGCKNALLAGEKSAGEMLDAWARDPGILGQLALLRSGKDASSRLLQDLYAQEALRQELRRAGDRRAAKLLGDAARKELEARCKKKGVTSFRRLFSSAVLIEWRTYVAMADRLQSRYIQGNLAEKVLEKKLQEAIDHMEMRVVENLFRALPK